MDLSWIPSLLCFVVGLLLIGFSFKRAVMNTSTKNKQSWKEQLEKEHLTQFVRHQPIPNELFLSIDFTTFPSVKDEECQKTYLALLAFADRPMVNLKGRTNLEIKEHFGPQGLELLSGYEKNYFEFMDICCKYGTILFEKDFILEAREVLEQSLLYQCDLSKCYLQLIDIYNELHDSSALKNLEVTAKKIMKDSPFLPKILKKISTM